MESIYKAIGDSHKVGCCAFATAVEKARIAPDFSDVMTELLRQRKDAKNRDKKSVGEAKTKAHQDLLAAKAQLKEPMLAIIDAAFQRLCTQFEYYLRRFYDAENKDRQQRGLIVLDHASYERDLELLMESFRKHGTAVTEIYNVIGAPFFGTSSATRLLQIADFISYAVYRRFEASDTRYFDLIAHRFDQVDGVFHGLSHVTLDSNCMCPGCLTRRVRKGG